MVDGKCLFQLDVSEGEQLVTFRLSLETQWASGIYSDSFNAHFPHIQFP